MGNYWKDRMAKAQAIINTKSELQIRKQLKRYYRQTAERAIADFETTVNKLIATVGEDRTPTPADLYKLDKYWQGQAQLKKELTKLGDKEIKILSAQFELNYFDIYYSINLPNNEAFNTIDKKAVQQMINSIWCADGKSWSQRIWDKTDKLLETLNEGLIHTVAAGKKTSELKKILQERFNVAYSDANRIVRTELAHIQTQAAKQRYTDYGIQEVEIWADKDERRCEVCGKLHQKKYPVGAAVPIPAHSNCRCCIVPVVK